MKNLDGSFDVQYIVDASSPIINMDYHSIGISEFPINPSTNQRYTPAEFFDYVRKNFDAFTDGFGPYNSTEESIWNSDYYLGAIMRFDISPFPGITQDGTVICSDQSHNQWIFTTIESPKDWDHPVSGHREFGLKQEDNGTYTFYTRGVDRVAESTDYFMGNLLSALTNGYIPTAFDGGEALWESVMDNLMSFVNDDPWYQGNAVKYPKSVNQPNWNEVRDVLEGRMSIADFGCN